jgi:hypothetical protein
MAMADTLAPRVHVEALWRHAPLTGDVTDKNRERRIIE